MRMVDEWRSAWKWASVQIAALAAVAMQLYEQVPQFQQYIPDKVFHHAMTGIVALIIVGRLIRRDDVQPPAK